MRATIANEGGAERLAQNARSPLIMAGPQAQLLETNALRIASRREQRHALPSSSPPPFHTAPFVHTRVWQVEKSIKFDDQYASRQRNSKAPRPSSSPQPSSPPATSRPSIGAEPSGLATTRWRRIPGTVRDPVSFHQKMGASQGNSWGKATTQIDASAGYVFAYLWNLNANERVLDWLDDEARNHHLRALRHIECIPRTHSLLYASVQVS